MTIEREINVVVAAELRERGMSWVDIGHTLAHLADRQCSFQAGSVLLAVKKAGLFVRHRPRTRRERRIESRGLGSMKARGAQL